MATYVLQHEPLGPNMPDCCEQLPMDMNFDDFVDDQHLDPTLMTFLDPTMQPPMELPSYLAQGSNGLLCSNIKDDQSAGFLQLPSAPHSNGSSTTQSPIQYHSQHGLQQWSMVDETGDLAPLETTFEFDPFPAEMDDFNLMSSVKPAFGVDPSLIQQLPTPNSMEPMPFAVDPALAHREPPPSRSASIASSWPLSSSNNPLVRTIDKSSTSPTADLPSAPLSRQHSIHSSHSHESHNGSTQPLASPLDDDSKERTVCPYPDCGKSFKDLKAHMLTHQNERPEKCPIVSCDFHKRGFARKYDRNRHLVTTHYKATVVCGFCPGEGSPSEQTFNRADVFKRHLVAAHGVDQNSNSSKKRGRGSGRQSPSSNVNTSGKCTTCGNIFSNAQELFDHLDDCILRVVTQTDPSESTNEKNLRSIIGDENVQATMKRHSLPNFPSGLSAGSCEEDEEGSEHGDHDGRAEKLRKVNSGDSLAIVNDAHVAKINEQMSSHRAAPGLTYSKGGVNLAVGKGRRRRKHYPQSWGSSADEMTLKKRVLCVFDGQRRLAKDDMMLSQEFQQRIELGEGAWVTDLDVKTLQRAEAFHNATEEERGPWLPTNFPDPSLFNQQNCLV